MKHQQSQEPWKVVKYSESLCIEDVNGGTVVSAWCGSQNMEESYRVDFDRIVTCVNACAGVTKEVLEANPILNRYSTQGSDTFVQFANAPDLEI